MPYLLTFMIRPRRAKLPTAPGGAVIQEHGMAPNKTTASHTKAPLKPKSSSAVSAALAKKTASVDSARLAMAFNIATNKTGAFRTQYAKKR